MCLIALSQKIYSFVQANQNTKITIAQL
jgi:hypothetical protein